MHRASDQLTKRAAFDQMRNVWPNVPVSGQLRCAFGQIYKNLQKMAKCARIWSNALHIWPTVLRIWTKILNKSQMSS